MSLENVSFETQSEMAMLLKKLADNPSTRADLLKSIKKIEPDFHIPELEIEQKTNDIFTKTKEELESLKAQMREKEAKEELSRRRQSLLKNGKAKSEEEIQEIEKLMVEKGINDHETGADYFSWMKQASETTPSGYNPQVLKQWDLGKFYKNPRQAAISTAQEALAEFRKQNRPIGL